MSEYTPGPWKIICKNNCVGTDRQIVSSGSCGIKEKPHTIPAQTDEES